MTIHIDALTLDVIIGLLDFERDRPQTVIVDLTVDYAYSEDAFIDYGDMVILLHNDLKSKRYILLEDALLGLKDILYAAYPHMQTLSIKISKPDIIAECSVALSETWHF
ncbi:MAG TPA: dihydroneopterin aldolase [Sulfurovum sp.]|nr:dihydroneopterin aldolase [Sulfurovum sp.]